MPDEKEIEQPAPELEEPTEEQKQPDPLKVEVGEIYFYYDIKKMEFKEYEIAFVDPDGDFIMTNEGKIVATVNSHDPNQILAFNKNYKKDKEEIRKGALDLIDSKIKGLNEVREKIKNG